MAKHAKKSHRAPSRSLTLVRAPAAKPVVIKQTKVVHAKSKKKHHHHHSGGMLGGLASQKRVGVAMGALAYGFIQKQAFFASLPALPVVGKAGTIAIGAYLLGRSGKVPLADDVCTAALTIAAYELGSTGTIQGEDGVDGVNFVAGY